jgi:endonuclease/exonuclease/phosphatase family metal-dependent hydrolase
MPAGAAGADQTLRVATFNIRTATAPDGIHSWWFRRRATLAAIRALDADLVGLQEVHDAQLSWLTPRLETTYHVVSRGRSTRDRGERTMVLARRDRVVVGDVSARWYADTPDQPGSRGWGNRYPRFVLLARCQVAGLGAPPFTFATTHLDHRSDDGRRRSASALARWLAEGADPASAAVVVGDMNCEARDPALADLAALPLHDALDHLPSRGAGAGTFHGFRGGSDGHRIDQILVGSGWAVTSSTIVRERHRRRLPSDHWPVAADLRWEGGGEVGDGRP